MGGLCSLHVFIYIIATCRLCCNLFWGNVVQCSVSACIWARVTKAVCRTAVTSLIGQKQCCGICPVQIQYSLQQKAQHITIQWPRLHTCFHNWEFVIEVSVLSAGWKDWNNVCSLIGILSGLKINIYGCYDNASYVGTPFVPLSSKIWFGHQMSHVFPNSDIHGKDTTLNSNLHRTLP
jgi:hypothetical protein